MIDLVRRRLLKGASFVLFAASGVFRSAIAIPNQPIQKIQKHTLRSYLDVLIPADSTPSASSLEVDLRVLEKSAEYEKFHKLLFEGTKWLDRQAFQMAVKQFSDLSQHQKIQVVMRAEQSEKRSLSNVFFKATLDDAFYYYYARPESWQGLGISRPTQPNGYLNQHLSPVRKK